MMMDKMGEQGMMMSPGMTMGGPGGMMKHDMGMGPSGGMMMGKYPGQLLNTAKENALLIIPFNFLKRLDQK